jgi:hypothetical protein
MRATEFVESYFDAWNHRDPKGVADHLTDDGIYCDIPEHSQHSHDELIAFLSGFFANNRQRYELIGEILTSKDTIAFQYRICPSEIVEEYESPTSYCGAEFMTLHGDAAMTITDYYDIPGRARPQVREVRVEYRTISRVQIPARKDYAVAKGFPEVRPDFTDACRGG